MTSPLEVTENLTIDGAGVAESVISGGGASQVFAIGGAPEVALSGMTVTEGSSATGAGIAATGTLALTRVDVVRNHAGGEGAEGSGGGIDFKGSGALKLVESSVSENSAGGGEEGEGFGGGIDYETTGGDTFALSLTRSRVEGNRAGGGGFEALGFGGGIDAAPGGEHGTVTVQLAESSVAGNTAGGAAEEANGVGGGIAMSTEEPNDHLTLEAMDSAITGNTAGGGASEADGKGGGLAFDAEGAGSVPTLRLENSTVSSNSVGEGNAQASGEGGGIAFTRGAVTLNHVTVADNAAGGFEPNGGGLDMVHTGVVENSILAANTGGNCEVTVTSGGHNLDDGTLCGFKATGDKVALNAKLGPLANHGGLTSTQLPLAGSPAIDGAERTTCPATDQRGDPRREGCDVGAVQLQPPSVESGSLVSGDGPTTAEVAVGVNPNFSETGYYFQYGTSVAYGSVSAVASVGESGSAHGAFVVLVNLKPSTLYHFRVLAFNAVGTVSGEDQTFTTAPAPPVPLVRAPTPKPHVAPLVSRPVLSLVRLTNRRFRVGNRSTAVTARKAPVGTRFLFRLSVAATVEIAITRSEAGLRHGHSCVAPTRRLRGAHAKRCTRTVSVGKLTRVKVRAGSDAISFTGRIGVKALAPANYTAALVASNSGGSSQRVTLAFTVVR